MNRYPLEERQRMLIRPNEFGPYSQYANLTVCLGEIVSTEKGIIARNCVYIDDQKEKYLDIPLFLLWRIADDEDLLEMHENYIHSKKFI